MKIYSKDAAGKTAIDSVKIEVKSNPSLSTAPLEFSPNGDGMMDKLAFGNPKITFAYLSVKIFDKEGKLFSDDYNLLLKNFKKMFSNPTDVVWEKASDGNFDVLFKDQGKACKVSFRIDGTWIETQTMANETEVPEIALTYVKKNFRN